MRAFLALALLLPSALAGCSEGQAPPAVDAGPLVEGYVLDEARAPVPDASVVVRGLTVNGTTGADGHFAFQAPTGVELLVTAQAPGFIASSQIVPAFSGSRHVLNFTLERMPFGEPYTLVSDFKGSVSCGLTAVVGEDPSSPHEHKGVRCSEVVPSETNVWNYTIPLNTTGLVFEAFWDPQTDLSAALVFKATIPETGEILGFKESANPARIQLSAVSLAQNLAAGHTVLKVVVTPGAGTGEHEHGAVGVFVEQEFQLVMTAFFNGPVDPTYSIATAS